MWLWNFLFPAFTDHHRANQENQIFKNGIKIAGKTIRLDDDSMSPNYDILYSTCLAAKHIQERIYKLERCMNNTRNGVSQAQRETIIALQLERLHQEDEIHAIKRLLREKVNTSEQKPGDEILTSITVLANKEDSLLRTLHDRMG